MYFHINLAHCGPGISETACPVCLHIRLKHVIGTHTERYQLPRSHSKMKFSMRFAKAYIH